MYHRSHVHDVFVAPVQKLAKNSALTFSIANNVPIYASVPFLIKALQQKKAILDGIEKGLPHHYFKMEDIPPLFPKLSIIDIHIGQVNHFS